MKGNKLAFKRVYLVGIVCALATLGGCGKKSGTISGKVTFEGKPLQFGSVIFVAADGKTTTAGIAKDGTYTSEKIEYGKFSVAVISPDPNPPNFTDKLPPGVKHPSGKAFPTPVKVDSEGWFAIPSEYGRASTSGLSI